MTVDCPVGPVLRDARLWQRWRRRRRRLRRLERRRLRHRQTGHMVPDVRRFPHDRGPVDGRVQRQVTLAPDQPRRKVIRSAQGSRRQRDRMRAGFEPFAASVLEDDWAHVPTHMQKTAQVRRPVKVGSVRNVTYLTRIFVVAERPISSRASTRWRPDESGQARDASGAD